jgi:linoleoyl-CoA desaturase
MTVAAQIPSPAGAEAAQRAAFARELDALGRKYFAKVGAEDVAYIAGIDKLSKRMKLLGRALIHVSLDPVTFSLGVGALWIGKQLNLAEIGHTVMHHTYDKVPGAEAFSGKTFVVDAPIDEEGWKHSHNVLHHSTPNQVGKDPDARFGLSRLNESVEWRAYHRTQLLEVAFNWLNMARNLNAQVTGLVDFYMRRAGDEDILADRKWKTVAKSHWRFARKAVPYAAVNYALIPALAGPFFPKVLLGNLLAETIRNAFTAIAIYCGHIGDEVADFPPEHKVMGKAEWYLMQISATANFEVSHPISVLVGALDHQIEHHVFPKMPPNRLRELAPEFRAICEKYEVPYKTAPWSVAFRGMVKRIVALGRKP